MAHSVASAKKKRLVSSAAANHSQVPRMLTAPSAACTGRVSRAVARCTAVNITTPTAKWVANWRPRVMGRECIRPTLRLFIR